MSAMRRVVGSLRRRLFGSPLSSQSPIWGGVYANLQEIPSSGSGFRSEEAVISQEALLRETESEPFPDEAEIDHQVLALAVRLTNTADVSVVDFGGGVGQSYAALRRMVDKSVRLRYRVVDLPPLVEHGRSLWSAHDEIDFAEELAALPERPDIVFSKGAIQYFEDYCETFRRLLALGASWVVLEKVAVIAGPTYASVQLNAYGYRIPCWFICYDELNNVAREVGYRTRLRRRLERTYDQSNFPPELRVSRFSSILYEREHPGIGSDLGAGAERVLVRAVS